MDISKTIKKLKEKEGFRENVGMILTHNGVVRGSSRGTKKLVQELSVTPNYAIIEQLRQEYLLSEGIFDIIIEAKSGIFKPGDDLLFIIVAGDIRENIKPVLSQLLDRIKAEAFVKQETLLP